MGNKHYTFKKQVYEERNHQKEILLWGAITKFFFTGKLSYKAALNSINFFGELNLINELEH